MFNTLRGLLLTWLGQVAQWLDPKPLRNKTAIVVCSECGLPKWIHPINGPSKWNPALAISRTSYIKDYEELHFVELVKNKMDKALGIK